MCNLILCQYSKSRIEDCQHSLYNLFLLTHVFFFQTLSILDEPVSVLDTRDTRSDLVLAFYLGL